MSTITASQVELQAPKRRALRPSIVVQRLKDKAPWYARLHQIWNATNGEIEFANRKAAMVYVRQARVERFGKHYDYSVSDQ